MKYKIIILLLIITTLISISILNIETYTKKGINYVVGQEKIKLGSKIYQFLERDQLYKKLLDKIFLDKVKIINQNKKINKILVINDWLLENIEKIKKEDTIVDFHPTTILERSKGTSDQFNDIYSILLVYENYDSFFINFDHNKNSYAFTFVKINNEWSIIDPYNGLYFINNYSLASINDIKKNNFKILSLKNTNQEIFKFYDEEVSQNDLKLKIQEIFMNFDLNKLITSKSKFKRGGRSYLQDPVNRIKYELLEKLNLI